MDDLIDQALRANAEVWRDTQSAPPTIDLPDRATRKRSAPLMAAAACAAVVIGIVLVTTIVNNRPTEPPVANGATATVPWPQHQPAAGTPPGRPAPEAPSGTPPCDSSQFTPSAPIVSGMTPPTILVNLTYQGEQTCSVNASGPWVVLTDSAGTLIGTDDGDTLKGQMVTQIAVRPEDVITTGITWNQWCGQGTPVAHTLRLHLAGNSDIAGPPTSVALSGIPTPACIVEPLPGGDVKQNLTALAPSIARPGDAATLLPTITAPPTVTAGDTLRYQVTLHNTTITDVALDPCPSYSQQLIDADAVGDIGSWSLLNCAQAPSTVPAGSSITFVMQVATSQQHGGPAKLLWSVASITDRVRTSPHAAAQVTIT